jgi:hypothetical protein
MQDSKTPFCCSKFPWARERISPKNTENLGTYSQRGLQALPYAVQHSNGWERKGNIEGQQSGLLEIMVYVDNICTNGNPHLQQQPQFLHLFFAYFPS